MTEIGNHIFQKKVLITPLNWGLGHASRCIPIIETLEQMGAVVSIAADGMALRFLRNTFPHLSTFELPDVHIEYAKHHQQWLQLLFKYPELNRQIKTEHRDLERLLNQHSFDLILSDNRYGCFHESLPSILITHQLYPKVPVLSSFAKKKIKNLLKPFDGIWVPDYEQEKSSLSGALSHPMTSKVTYIGPQSQFGVIDTIQPTKDLAILLSGPEPQRTKLEIKLSAFLKDKELSGYFIRGTDVRNEALQAGKLEVIDLAFGKDLFKKLTDCKKVIARGGYSTIMDMHMLNKSSLLIPTKGQPEQEYLSQFHEINPLFLFADQTDAFLYDKLEAFITSPLPKKDTKKRSIQKSLLSNALLQLNF